MTKFNIKWDKQIFKLQQNKSHHRLGIASTFKF